MESEAPHLPASSIISGAEHSTPHDGEEETNTSSHDGEEETKTPSQDVINTDNSNDDSLEVVQNQSSTTLPKDESANEVRTADQPSTHHGTASTKEKQRDWTWEEIMKNWRKFNIDLAPKVSIYVYR